MADFGSAGPSSLLPQIMALGPAADLTISGHSVLAAIAFLDDVGIVEPPFDWIAHAANLTTRRLRDVVNQLSKQGWLTVTRSQKRGIPKRVQIVSEKLNSYPAPWSQIAAGGSPTFFLQSRKDSVTLVEFSENAGGNISALGDSERARTSGRPYPSLIHPSFDDFPWSSEKIKNKAKLLLLRCGPGLAPIERDPQRMFSSMDVLLAGPWSDDLEFEREILPLVAEKTRSRPPGKEYRDFFLIHRTLLERRESRQAKAAELQSQQRARAGSRIAMKAPPSSPAPDLQPPTRPTQSRTIDLSAVPEGAARDAARGLYEHYEAKKVDAWFADAVWTNDQVYLPSDFARSKVDSMFGGYLRQRGFSVSVVTEASD